MIVYVMLWLGFGIVGALMGSYVDALNKAHSKPEWIIIRLLMGPVSLLVMLAHLINRLGQK